MPGQVEHFRAVGYVDLAVGSDRRDAPVRDHYGLAVARGFSGAVDELHPGERDRVGIHGDQIGELLGGVDRRFSGGFRLGGLLRLLLDRRLARRGQRHEGGKQHRVREWGMGLARIFHGSSSTGCRT